MKPSDLIKALSDAITYGEQVLVTGDPGVGKTDLWGQATARVGVDLMISHPAVAEPVDFRGYPAKVDEFHATHLPFGDLWRAINAKKPLLWLVDDLGQASESTLKALMQLLHGRRLNGHTLPPYVIFGGATNKTKQMAGVQGIIEPVKSRFTTIVELTTSIDDWCDWALDHDMPGALVAFMQGKESCLPDGKHLLNNFVPTKELTNSPCPRTWAAVGRMFNRGCRSLELFEGAVGQAAAAQFMAFIEVVEKGPNIEDILRNPDGADIPTQPSLKYLVSIALEHAATDQNFDRVMRYLNRLEQPYRVRCMQGLARNPAKDHPKHAELQARKDAIRQTQTFNRWILTEGKEVLGTGRN